MPVKKEEERDGGDRNMVSVSVYCLAYNHEKTIRRSLEGMVRQKTDFDFEMIVHDDASTDRTAVIIRTYAAKYPKIIRPVCQTENQWSRGISIVETQIRPRVRGKYIAICEGDDYWTDSHKLQKQYDYMETHPDCTLCFTNAVIRNEGTGTRRTFVPYSRTDAQQFDSGKEDYDLHSSRRLTFIPTASFFFRTECYDALMSADIPHCPVDDLRLRLFVTSLGYAHFINEKTCVYREGSAESIMKGWKEQNVRKAERDARMNYRMLAALDQYTDYNYHKGLLPFMATSAAAMLENAPLHELCTNRVYREILSVMKPDRRIKTILKAMKPKTGRQAGGQKKKRHMHGFKEKGLDIYE
jgi:glycosyltransferase involved in cell wall biosynthesis